jgi:hypothetical protein
MRYSKYFRVSLLVSLALPCLHSYSQEKPILSVQSFEYIWQKASTEMNVKGQVIIADENSIKHGIEKSFVKAISQRWDITVPDLSLSVKPLSLFSFSYEPKFNTKLKEKQPGTWYLFLQIFDAGNSFYYNPDGAIVTELKIKCKIVNVNDSVILNRNLRVRINKQKIPSDQVALKRLPGYPSSFPNVFDSIAAWLFQQEDITEKAISVMPACVFTETTFNLSPIAQLEFERADHQINYPGEPQFAFNMPGPTYVKTKKSNNTGGNIANGTISLLTGVPTNKKKTFEYNADFPFEAQDSSTYHCVIHFAEVQAGTIEREKEKDANGSTSYSLHSTGYDGAWRKVEPVFEDFITLGSDTLATFNIRYSPDKEYKSYTRFWNGRDSNTIADLPGKWTNDNSIENVLLAGTIGGIPFTMQSRNELTEKQFYINDKLVLVTYGADAPVRELLFQPISELQLKLFTILSSIPYSYFNTM